MEGESGVTRSILEEVHNSEIQGDQMVGKSGVTRRIINKLHSLDKQRDEMEGEVVLLEVSLANFILRISKEIK